MEELAFRIGRSQAETVKLTYLGSRYQDWAEFRVDAVLSPFRCSFAFDTQCYDVVHFSEKLHRLHEVLAGTATFHTMEGQVDVATAIDKLGHVTWTIKLNPHYDQPTLTAVVVEDQSMLPPLIEELRTVIAAMRNDGALVERGTT